MEPEFGKTGRINRLSSLLRHLSREEVLAAAAEYDEAEGQIDSYDHSTQYDLVIGGKAYPPKAIFGLAASAHLKFDVLSKHFTGGEDSTSFRILKDLGFEIRPKTNRPGPREGLVLHQSYSRRDVCEIFGFGDTFRSGSGLWGLQGIIPNRPLPGDFVLFVTLGTYDGNRYEDAITEDGALIWKSQDRHTQKSPVVQQLVGHNESKNLLSLFLRTNEKDDYTYLGPLSFNDWDPNSEKPVHFVWDIINWPIPSDLRERMGLKLLPALSPAYQPSEIVSTSQELKETPPPEGSKDKKKSGGKGPSNDVDWAARESRNRKLGLAGEKLVLKGEIDELIANGRKDLADQVVHVAAVDSAAGYDILSFHAEDGSEKFIEVKTTTGNINTPFFISSNEVSNAEHYGEAYWIYRVYGFSPSTPALFYRLRGSVHENFELSPTAFRAERKKG